MRDITPNIDAYLKRGWSFQLGQTRSPGSRATGASANQPAQRCLAGYWRRPKLVGDWGCSIRRSPARGNRTSQHRGTWWGRGLAGAALLINIHQLSWFRPAVPKRSPALHRASLPESPPTLGERRVDALPHWTNKAQQHDWFRPFRWPFSFGETRCRSGGMNIASVTIAEASIGLSVRLRATAAGAADGQRHTAGRGSRVRLRGHGRGCWNLAEKLPKQALQALSQPRKPCQVGW